MFRPSDFSIARYPATRFTHSTRAEPQNHDRLGFERGFGAGSGRWRPQTNGERAIKPRVGGGGAVGGKPRPSIEFVVVSSFLCAIVRFALPDPRRRTIIDNGARSLSTRWASEFSDDSRQNPVTPTVTDVPGRVVAGTIGNNSTAVVCRRRCERSKTESRRPRGVYPGDRGEEKLITVCDPHCRENRRAAYDRRELPIGRSPVICPVTKLSDARSSVNDIPAAKIRVENHQRRSLI